MAELVDALEERTMTWPEKWKANYIAEGRAEGRLLVCQAMLSSLQEAVGQRFGESAAQIFEREIEFARKGDAAQDVGIVMSICQCVMQSKTAEQLLAHLQTIRPKAE